MIQHTSNSERETERFAAKLAKQLRGGDVLTLHGPLGAGKTCFVRGLAAGLGIDSKQVSSPTFTMTQEYTGEKSLTLIHMDAYRLHGTDELESLGWNELIESPDVILAIEWPSRIEDAIRDLVRIDITLEPVSVSQRLIQIHVPAEQAARLEGLHG